MGQQPPPLPKSRVARAFAWIVKGIVLAPIIFVGLIVVLFFLLSIPRKFRDPEVCFEFVFKRPRPANVTVHHAEWDEWNHMIVFGERTFHLELDGPPEFVDELRIGATREPVLTPDRPAWFAPKPEGAYETFTKDDRIVLIDRETKRVFVGNNRF